MFHFEELCTCSFVAQGKSSHLIFLLVSRTNSYFSVENTRTVAKNLGCRNQHDGNLNPNRVDVLIPDVIQVSLFFYKIMIELFTHKGDIIVYPSESIQEKMCETSDPLYL